MQSKFVVREPGNSAWDAWSYDRLTATEDLIAAFDSGRTRARVFQFNVFGQQTDITVELLEEYYENMTGEY